MHGLDLHSWETIMVLSLVVAGIAAVVVGFSTFLVVKLQRQEVKATADAFAQYKIDAGVKIAEASEGAAKANERAAEANLALEKFKAPRSISPQERQLIVSSVGKFAGQEFKVTTYPDLKEAVDFATQLSYTLAEAKWKFIQPDGSFPFPGVAGVLVWVHVGADPKVKDAANALVLALEIIGKAPTLKHTAPNSPIDNKIELTIGTKP